MLAASLCAILAAQSTVGVIRSHPLPSPQETAALESRLLVNPEDLDARVQLLQLYLDTATSPAGVDPVRQSLRLQHILYLVEHHPEAQVSGSRIAYVYRANGPYANPSDHEAVRAQWLAAVQSHAKNTAVVLNAVRFLEVEEAGDAERVLQRAIDADPENRELAANLGFLYAREMLGRDAANHAVSELRDSSNPIVLAAAGTALPNLAKTLPPDPTAQRIFDFASELSARARQLAPNDSDIQGPMPLIRYFAAAQPATGPPPQAPARTRIRLGDNLNLIRRTEPIYPEEARRAGITGEVRMTATVGRDGTIQNIELISGHPLLVQAAIQAVKTWLYQPTLLNGAPVEVVTTISVAFPPY